MPGGEGGAGAGRGRRQQANAVEESEGHSQRRCPGGNGGDAAAPVVRRPWIWVCGGQTQARDNRILCKLAPYGQRLPLLWLRGGEGEGGDEGALTRVREGEEAVAGPILHSRMPPQAGVGH